MLNISNIRNFFTIKISIKNFNDIVKEPDLLKQLRSLTLNPYSGMNNELNYIESRAKERQVKSYALLAYKSGDLVGWALFSEEPSTFYFTNNYGYNPEDGILFQVYVDPQHRRIGIGSQLIKVAKRLSDPKKLCVCPWDTNSYGFYNNFKHFEYKAL